MTIKSNFPSIRPSLNLDFANVKALDPRITFTRTTTATYYDGRTTAKAEENLLKYSQAFTDASWTDTDCTVTDNDATAPDGTSTAATMLATNANAVLTQGYTAIAGSYTFSVWLRRVTGTGDIEIAADNGTWTTKVITGTWARYDVTQTVAAGSKTAGVRVVTDTDEIEVWGAQLEQRSAVTDYTPTTTAPITNYIPVLQTAASGVARFDHNPTTGESLGLLVEEQRTNLYTYSDDFANAAWTKTNTTITANTIVAPDGTLTGDKLVLNSGDTNGQVSLSNSYTSGTAYTFSCFAKQGEQTDFRIITPTSAFGSALNGVFNLSTGTVTSFTATSASITSVGNGWYRCSITATATSTTTGFSQLRSNYTGDGYSGIYIWGAQLEAGAFPTSYIATTSASVTRNADAASMTGTNFSSWYRADEGTVYTDSSIARAPTSAASIVAISDGTGANFIDLRYRSTGKVGAQSVTNSSVQVNNTTGPSVTANQVIKDSLAFATNNVAESINGAAVIADNSAILPVVNIFRIGGDAGGGTFVNGTIKKIAYYPARLSDAQLQALTTV